jgi:rubrerythrin
MQAILQYAFMDESGTVGVNGSHFLIVAATTLLNPRDVEKPIRNAFRQALKKFGAEAVSEVKASDLDEPVILRLLTEIAQRDVQVFITVVDQQAIRVPPRDKEEIYRQAAAGTVRRLAEKFPRLELSIDKRHTNAHLRRLLEKAIRDEIESLPRQNVLIQQENSVTRKELQAADAVAWAIFQKYEHDDLRFYEVIQSKVVDETVISQKDWR